VRFADRAGQTGLVRRRQDEVNVVGHQTLGPAGDAVAAKLLAHQAEINRLIAGFEEDGFAPVSR
jgi:hypothetical protein